MKVCKKKKTCTQILFLKIYKQCIRSTANQPKLFRFGQYIKAEIKVTIILKKDRYAKRKVNKKKQQV